MLLGVWAERAQPADMTAVSRLRGLMGTSLRGRTRMTVLPARRSVALKAALSATTGGLVVFVRRGRRAYPPMGFTPYF
jgi:hypothetical protein